MASDLVYISARVPLIDERTGMLNRDWFRFFEQIGQKAQIINGNLATSALAGSASALPAFPAGYMIVTLNGQDYKVPYYK